MGGRYDCTALPVEFGRVVDLLALGRIEYI